MSKINVLYCPVEGKAEFREIESSIHEYYKLINCSCIDMKTITEDGLTLIIDDEGRFNEEKKTNPHLYPLTSTNFGMGIVGDYLLVKVDFETGDTISLNNQDIEEITKIIEMESKEPLKSKIANAIVNEEEYLKNNPQILEPVVLTGDEVFEHLFGKE